MVPSTLYFLGRRYRRNVFVRFRKASNAYFSERMSRRHKCFRRENFDLLSWQQEPNSVLVKVYLGVTFDGDKKSWSFPIEQFKVSVYFLFSRHKNSQNAYFSEGIYCRIFIFLMLRR